MTSTNQIQRNKISNVGTIVLDKNLIVKFHSLPDGAEKILGLPIAKVKLLHNVPDVETFAKEAMQTKLPVQKEFETDESSKALALTFAHYLDALDQVDGVIITLTESITEQSGSEDYYRYRSVFKSSVNVMIIFDFDGNILDQNHVSPGLTFDDVKGGNWRQYTPVESIKVIEAQLKRVEETNEAEFLEVSVPSPEGDMKHYWNSMTPILTEDGTRACLSTAVDVTDLRNAQRELEEHKEFIESINSTVPLLLYIFDNRTQTNVFSNKDVVLMLGYTYEEFNKFENGFVDVIHPDDVPLVLEHQKLINESKDDEIIFIESRLRAKSGEYRHFMSWDKCHLRDDNGKVIQHIGASQDVTEMKKRDLELAEKDRYYRTMFEGSLDSLTIFDHACNVLDVNHQLYGWEKDQLLGTGWKKAIPREDADYIHSQIRRFLTDEKIVTFELAMENAFGRKRTYMNSLMPVEVANGENHILMASSDITEVRSTQKALSESARQKEALAQSNDDLEQFAYVASHDLQEPIRIVNQYLQLLRAHLGEHADDTTKKYIDFSVDASNRMRDLVNGLLEFARMNNQELNASEMDLNSMLKSIVDFSELKIKEVQAKVNVGQFPPVIGDEVLCRQLLQNLVSNALKFHDSSRTVEVNISYSSDKENHIITVEDNGIGIEPNHLEKMFLIFKRGHHKDKYDGHGIGLTLCKQIVERHGGAIWIESDLGEGTRVSFSIPKKLATQSE